MTIFIVFTNFGKGVSVIPGEQIRSAANSYIYNVNQNLWRSILDLKCIVPRRYNGMETIHTDVCQLQRSETDSAG